MGERQSGPRVRISVAEEAPRPSAVSGVHRCARLLEAVQCLLVEDVALVAEAEKRLLTFHGANVTIEGTLAGAARALQSKRWDLLVVDLGLPDGAGDTLVASARVATPGMGVLVVSGAMNSARAIAMQALGAVVMAKDGTNDDLVQAASAALRRLPSAEPPIERAIKAYAGKYELSSRETETLRLAFHGRSTNKEIADHLGVAAPTVATYWARIATKTGCGGKGAIFRHFALECVASGLGS